MSGEAVRTVESGKVKRSRTTRERRERAACSEGDEVGRTIAVAVGIVTVTARIVKRVAKRAR